MVSWRIDEQDWRKITSKLLGGSICKGLPLKLLKVFTSSVWPVVGDTFETDPLFKLAAERGLSKRILFVSTNDVLVIFALLLFPLNVAFDNSATDEDDDSLDT